MMIRKVLSFVVMALFLFCSTTSYATSANSQAQDKKLDIGALGPTTSGGKSKAMVENTYIQTTYENLYKLAWSYSAFSAADDEDLNTYLMITECNLYNKFFQNEFEWEKIKIATRKFIADNQDKVPKYYEYVQPIYLGRYDYSLQGFPIIVDAQEFKGQKNLQFAKFQSGETSCGRLDVNGKKYPSEGVVSLLSPLNLSFIRVPLPLAEKYIEWRSKQQNLEDGKRQAYIRYRIRIDGYEGFKSYSIGVDAFAFNGKLMRLDVFADKDLLLPLYNQVF